MSTAHRNFTSLTNLIKKFVVLDHKFTTVFRAGIIQKQPWSCYITKAILKIFLKNYRKTLVPQSLV